MQPEILNKLWAHDAKSFRSGNCVNHSEQVDAKVGRGFVVKALAWIITRDKSLSTIVCLALTLEKAWLRKDGRC